MIEQEQDMMDPEDIKWMLHEPIWSRYMEARNAVGSVRQKAFPKKTGRQWLANSGKTGEAPERQEASIVYKSGKKAGVMTPWPLQNGERKRPIICWMLKLVVLKMFQSNGDLQCCACIRGISCCLALLSAVVQFLLSLSWLYNVLIQTMLKNLVLTSQYFKSNLEGGTSAAFDLDTIEWEHMYIYLHWYPNIIRIVRS